MLINIVNYLVLIETKSLTQQSSGSLFQTDEPSDRNC